MRDASKASSVLGAAVVGALLVLWGLGLVADPTVPAVLGVVLVVAGVLLPVAVRATHG